MLMIDIPFAPERDRSWTVAIGRNRRQHFATRKDAVEFAASEAERLQRAERCSVVINIEGADGMWRPFRTSLDSIT
ncbi:MAG TPA: hypothetical protein VIM98_12045 [Dyella sp.]|uniref:hypothetical protein n=1 Tax=Dyella sp. TaxID=1869338 RepID=UPI002F929C17